GRVVVWMALTAPRRARAALRVGEEWLATAHPGRGSKRSDGQPGLLGGHDRPAPFLRGRRPSRGRHTESCLELWRVVDALVSWCTRLHPLEKPRCSHICPGNWTGERPLCLQRCRKAKKGRVPVACGSFGTLTNRLQSPPFSTCMRGVYHGFPALLLPVGVAQRSRRRVLDAPGAPT